MRERRRVPRVAVFKSAKVVFNGSLRDCIVRDLSSLGARLAFVSTSYLPDKFALTFDSARTLRGCRVAWRTSTEVGVEFQEGSFRSAA
jgi:PilZ domain